MSHPKLFFQANPSAMYYYYEIYRKLLVKSWNNMEPMEYGSLLIAIALVGWFCMRSSLKR